MLLACQLEIACKEVFRRKLIPSALACPLQAAEPCSIYLDADKNLKSSREESEITEVTAA